MINIYLYCNLNFKIKGCTKNPIKKFITPGEITVIFNCKIGYVDNIIFASLHV